MTYLHSKSLSTDMHGTHQGRYGNEICTNACINGLGVLGSAATCTYSILGLSFCRPSSQCTAWTSTDTLAWIQRPQWSPCASGHITNIASYCCCCLNLLMHFWTNTILPEVSDTPQSCQNVYQKWWSGRLETGSIGDNPYHNCATRRWKRWRNKLTRILGTV